MDLKSIKEILDSHLTEESKEQSIMIILVNDEKVIPTILKLLEEKRKQEKELILDSTAELSRALVVLKDKNLKYNKKIICDPKWVVEKIKEHFLKWQDHIRCEFKIEGLP